MFSGAGGSVGSDGGFSVERVLHTCGVADINLNLAVGAE